MDKDSQVVIGVDEVGFGAWAGPLVVGGAALPSGWSHPSCRDSKAFSTHRARKGALTEIKPNILAALTCGIDPYTIDTIGVEAARTYLFKKVSEALLLRVPGACVVFDGDSCPLIDVPARYVSCVPRADSTVPAVSAASMLAKVERDEEMTFYDDVFPGYGFGSHKGYGTAEHQRALTSLGPCGIHRFSYKPLHSYVVQSERWRPLRKIAINAWMSWLMQ